MSSLDRFRTELDCESHYNDIWAVSHILKTVALTFIIIVLTISIEIAVHSEINSTSNNKKTQSAQDELSGSESPTSDASPSNEESNTTKDMIKGKSNLNPSATIRANRLTLATILIIPLCVAFGFRIADTALPNIRDDCREILKSSIQFAWGWIIPLNIIPFIIASVAWIRAFIDCLLVRWERTLQYPNAVKGSGIRWPPFAPLFWIFVVVRFPVMVFWQLVKKGAVWIMGSPNSAESATEDIELGGGERVRLVDDFDEAVVDEGEEPPAYDANWRENETGIKSSQ
jgi:hypothetical protein